MLVEGAKQVEKEGLYIRRALFYKGSVSEGLHEKLGDFVSYAGVHA